jgi:hypothetical protein
MTSGPSSGYAGGVDQTIVFTNTSGATCTLYGYPGVSLVSAPPHTQIGLAAQRSGTTPVKLITLASGATASAVLQVVDALNFGTATCSPTKAAFLHRSLQRSLRPAAHQRVAPRTPRRPTTPAPCPRPDPEGRSLLESGHWGAR